MVMSSSIIISGTSQPSSVLIYTELQPMSGGSVSLGPAYEPSSSWRKFIQTEAQQTEFESSITVILSEKVTTEGPIVLKPAPISENIDVQGESFFRFLDELESGAYAANDITTEE